MGIAGEACKTQPEETNLCSVSYLGFLFFCVVLFSFFLVLFNLYLNQLSPEWKSFLYKLSRSWGRLGIYWTF